MNLEYIEDLIEKENIYLIDTYLEDAKGAYANNGNIKAILYNNDNIENSIEKKLVLSEELGHYYCDATYKFDSDLQLISKQEYRAKKWSYNVLIPFEKLRRAILNRS